jgi:secreted trypsin-like serine protease
MSFFSFFFLTAQMSFAIINGQSANLNKYAAVGSIDIDAQDSVACTATLIAPNWIVTADHCIHAMSGSEEDGSGELVKPEGYEFRLGYDFHNPIYKVKLKRWIGGPQINGETVDIAFGELSQPVPVKDLNISLISAKTLSWNKSDLKSTYTHIGYGVLKVFSNETSSLSDKRQKAEFTVTSIRGNALLQLFGSEQNLENYVMKYHPQSIEAGSFEAIVENGNLLSGYNIHVWDARGRQDLNNISVPTSGWQDTCFGDSGGPLLREIKGQVYIIGVVSQGMDRICSPMGTKFTIFGPQVQKLMKSLDI